MSAACAFAACFHALVQISVLAESFLSAKSLLEGIYNQILGNLEFLAWTVLLGYLAWGAYRLSMRAWWCAVIMVMIWGVSSGIERLLAPTHQIWQMTFGVLYLVAILGYLLYLRGFFKQAGNEPSSGADPRVETAC